MYKITLVIYIYIVNNYKFIHDFYNIKIKIGRFSRICNSFSYKTDIIN